MSIRYVCNYCNEEIAGADEDLLAHVLEWHGDTLRSFVRFFFTEVVEK